jgi:hypothetical protein
MYGSHEQWLVVHRLPILDRASGGPIPAYGELDDLVLVHKRGGTHQNGDLACW